MSPEINYGTGVPPVLKSTITDSNENKCLKAILLSRLLIQNVYKDDSSR